MEKHSSSQSSDLTDRIYQEILRIRSEGESAALATVMRTRGPTPGKTLFKMLVYAGGEILGSVGGGAFEAKVISEALEVIKTEEARVFEFRLSKCGEDLSDNQPICGGEMEVLIEPIVRRPTLYIMGAGHVGLALSGIGRIAGFRTVVVDDREKYADKTRFEDADEVLVSDFGEIADKIKVDKSSYVVIVTRGHQHDKTVLKAFIHSNAAYIGMIGSKKKVKEVFQSLIQEGVDKKLLDCVFSPIGLDIGAQTASEIAISIVAEIIAHNRGRLDSVKTMSGETKK